MNGPLDWTVVVSATGDFATAEDRESALVAARTMVDDHWRAGGCRKTTRQSVTIVHRGQYDGTATMAARRGVT